ncbi:hypothetical protein ABNQ39_20645 [Azospirillum sp. A26]|uniref:hypothetical protein n=1 Tax=Azospirillum sp. A26 TaxID=3160607 RepID=UPI00366E7456
MVTMKTLETVNTARCLYECHDASSGIYDGGVRLVCDGDVADGAGDPQPGHYRISAALGLVQVGALPVFGLTAGYPHDADPHELAGAAHG